MKGRTIAAVTVAAFLLVCDSCWALASPPSNTHDALQVDRMTADEYRAQRKHSTAHEMDRPILITDAMALEDCERWCNEWIQEVGSETITIQRKRQPEGETKLYDCTVAQSLELMMQSTPRDSIFAFVEGLLDDGPPSLQSMQSALTQARESLFVDNDNDDSKDWFDWFPLEVQPTDCVVMAGEGATSTLHRDPFEWTGTSLCLEGRKIWRFLSPSPSSSEHSWDDCLQSYRLPSTAWDSHDDGQEEADPLVLSAGWQSDLTLYFSEHTTGNNDNMLLSARDLAGLSNEDSETYLEEMASTTTLLPPHPTLSSRIKLHENCCSVVQHPGELLLIPSQWYHQTYAAEPSLAVASQRCGSSLDAPRVLQHIAALQSTKKQSTMPEQLKDIIEGKGKTNTVDPQEVVDLLFEWLQQK